MAEVLVVLGTRPEAVKLRPVLEQAQRYPDWTINVCATGQHSAALLGAAGAYGPGAERLTPPSQSAGSLVVQEHMCERLRRRFRARPPGLILAQGDTASVLAAARAASQTAIPFVHLEAGLRTFDRRHPFPEEDIRVEVATLASLHLAPTWRAFEHLRCEGVEAEAIIVTGNTSVDAVRRQAEGLPPPGPPPVALLSPHLAAALSRHRGWILVTHHRAESLPEGLRGVRDAVEHLARAHPELCVVWPVHPNPAIAAELEGWVPTPNICLVAPMSHVALLWLLRGASLVITDSGGVQEEAPEFGVPVLVTRRRTERMEAVEQGRAQLVGYDAGRIVDAAERALLAAPDPSLRRDNPFGDGAAAMRCVAALRWRLRMPGADRPRSWRPQVPVRERQNGTVRRVDDPAWRLLPS